MAAPQWAKRAGWAVAALALTGVGSGCGGDDQPEARPSGPSMMAPETRQSGLPMQSSSNRALFLSIDFMMQMAELVEIVRLRLGGSPRRQ